MKDPRERLIIALDVPDLAGAGSLLTRLRPLVQWFKVGSELFTAAGPRAVAAVLGAGGRVFLDVKYHDIPHTVGRAVAAAAGLGVSMLNVHAAGGEAMLRAASAAREGTDVLLLGVTALTSLDEDPAYVVEQARRVQAAGLDGVVASAREVALIKRACGERFVVVTPGIRPAEAAPDDQRRTATPGEAMTAGSDFLVVGRPVTAAADPLKAAERILDEMRHALPSPA